MSGTLKKYIFDLRSAMKEHGPACGSCAEFYKAADVERHQANVVAFLAQLAAGEWLPELTYNFEEDAREQWPARQARIRAEAQRLLAELERKP